MKFTNPAPRACADVSPQLTALFDGEADDAQARAARAHLLSCPACARQWLDWTRYRDTFRSEPAPIVPPTLLWRVLIAYRIAAFARPARRRSRLPQISAAPLRGIEAPLPPRLSAHILARTTRKPNAHVMLTPMQGAPVAATRFKARSFRFGRAPLWAAPALALWVLMLIRADFNASLPVATPGSALVSAPAAPEIAAITKENSVPVTGIVAPIPVASRAPERANVVASSGVSASTFIAATPPDSLGIAPRSRPLARRENAIGSRLAVVAPNRVVASARAQRVAPNRAETRDESGLSRAFALAINAGQDDISRARTAPFAVLNRARAVPLASAVAASQTPLTRAQTPIERTLIAPDRATPSRVMGATRANSANARVTLAALASPISSVRTVSSARLRTAAFSDDSMRPRVAHPSASGRRFARLMLDEDETRLRVSRPLAQAPTLRQTNGNADNGPKLDELRSAVDDFRASIASDQ